MPGSVRTLHRPRELDLGDAVTESIRIEIRLRWQQYKVRPFAPKQREILLQRSWVTGKIGWIVELRRIDENSDQRPVVLRTAASHQRHVSLVQRAHRRYETERHSSTDLVETLAAPLGWALENGRHE